MYGITDSPLEGVRSLSHAWLVLHRKCLRAPDYNIQAHCNTLFYSHMGVLMILS